MMSASPSPVISHPVKYETSTSSVSVRAPQMALDLFDRREAMLPTCHADWQDQDDLHKH